jgi:hypothetical protein
MQSSTPPLRRSYSNAEKQKSGGLFPCFVDLPRVNFTG